MKWLGCLLMGCWMQVVCAESIEATVLTEDSNVTLTIKPHICVAPRGETSCISRIDISWQSDRPTDLCLYVSEVDQSLQCWQQQQSGAFKHHVTVVKNLEYWLSSMPQNNLLAKSWVKFAALKPHRKHKRRRNHLPWSIQSL